MKASISRWGNSLGLRIPKELADELGLKAGTQVTLQMKGGKLTVEASPRRRRYRLADLLVGMTPAATRKTYDWGPDVGREAVD